MTKNERQIAPTGFTAYLDDNGPALNLKIGDGDSLTLRFQHPGFEARKVGLCLIAYGLLAESDPNDREFLYHLSTDLRDVIQTVQQDST